MIATLFRNRAAQHRLAAGAPAGVVVVQQALPATNAAPPAALIAIDDLVKEYATGAGPVRVLHDVSLRVQPGEFVAVVGASGSGKSTLINMITGIDRPTSGDVQVAGHGNQARVACLSYRSVEVGSDSCPDAMMSMMAATTASSFSGVR